MKCDGLRFASHHNRKEEERGVGRGRRKSFRREEKGEEERKDEKQEKGEEGEWIRCGM